MANRTRFRTGFTLIELIVVITIMILLVSLAALVASGNLFDSYRRVGANDRVSGWLIQAKAMAQRDKAPRGVRFLVNQNTNSGTYLITEAQFIEVPEPYIPIPAANPTTGKPINLSNPPRVVIANGQLYFTGVDSNTPGVTAGQDDLTLFMQNVEVGDSVQLFEFNVLLNITGTPTPMMITGTSKQGANAPIPAVQIPINTALLPNIGSATHYQTISFAIQRKARPLMGEPLMQIPSEMCINPSIGLPKQTAPIPSDIDILFSANGEVLRTTEAVTVLWLHKINAAGPLQQREGGLTVISTKTGAISTQPLPPRANPNVALDDTDFKFARDGINSGL